MGARRGEEPGAWDRTGAGVVLLTGAFLAGWWLIGELSADFEDLDHLDVAPDVPAWIVAVTGLGGMVAAGLALRRRWRSPGRWPAMTVLAGGLVLAWVGRVATAGTVGANIGGGIALLFVLPPTVLVTMAAFALLAVGGDRA